MEDTISAVATAWGEGGIGIVRISGPKSYEILQRIFIPKRPPLVHRQLTYGQIVDPSNQNVIDEVLAVFMQAPHTYTTEDIAEIHCHGSSVALQRVLALTLEHGARIAEPGEFTKRAFLNGRIDLSQAEAVIDLIRAKTEKSFDAAMNQMEGVLSQKICAIREKLTDLLVTIAVNLDYPDEDIEEITYEQMDNSLRDIESAISLLLETAQTGKLLREGISIAIAGKPNVGKSSLMNQFLRESRAIVTDIPGTTRDTIEESLNLRGFPVRLIDTAGIREAGDIIEKIGIEKSKEVLAGADFVIFMLDGSRPLTLEDREAASHIREKKSLILVNKTDLDCVLTEEEAKSLIPDASVMFTSMESGEGMREAEEYIFRMLCNGDVVSEQMPFITNVRHIDCIKKAQEEIQAALLLCQSNQALDFIEVNVRQGFEYLGEIIGETVSDTIIDEVFSRFCLGK